MPLPRRLARFNRVATNRVALPIARRFPGLGIVAHVGRVSGRRYRTPVAVFGRDEGLAVALTYGPGTDWARNVLAAGRAEVTTGGRARTLTNPRVVQDEARPYVPPPVRLALRVLRADWFLLLDGPDEPDDRR